MSFSDDDAATPRALAIPRQGYFTREEGVMAWCIQEPPPITDLQSLPRSSLGPGKKFERMARLFNRYCWTNSNAFAPLKLHFLRWALFDIGVETFFMYQAIFDTDFDKYTEDAIALFRKYGIDTAFENLEDFPPDWKTNVPAFVKFVREHQCPSFLEYAEYPYVTGEEIKKALQIKRQFAAMLDQMQ